MRTIKKIHNAEYVPVRDLITYSPLPGDRSFLRQDLFKLIRSCFSITMVRNIMVQTIRVCPLVRIPIRV